MSETASKPIATPEEQQRAIAHIQSHLKDMHSYDPPAELYFRETPATESQTTETETK